MIKPERFEVIRTPRTQWFAAVEALRSTGGLEVMIYFAGSFGGAEGTVTRLIVPRQRQSAAGCELDLDEVNRVSAELTQAREVLLWQLHSHPGDAFLSHTDRSWPASRKTGWISAVAPSFGRGVTSPHDLRVYEYLGQDDWRELDERERCERLVIA
jgi:proteasome lid subunit RPN8/RPN11